MDVLARYLWRLRKRDGTERNPLDFVVERAILSFWVGPATAAKVFPSTHTRRTHRVPPVHAFFPAQTTYRKNVMPRVVLVGVEKRTSDLFDSGVMKFSMVRIFTRKLNLS
jgi:hypothetical protein